MATTPERLMYIETILERIEPKLDADFALVRLEIKGMRDEIAADKADLAALKNRGAGILIGIAVLAAVVGAKVGAVVTAITAAFK